MGGAGPREERNSAAGLGCVDRYLAAKAISPSRSDGTRDTPRSQSEIRVQTCWTPEHSEARPCLLWQRAACCLKIISWHVVP